MKDILKHHSISFFMYVEENNTFKPRSDFGSSVIIAEFIKLTNILKDNGIDFTILDNYEIKIL